MLANLSVSSMLHTICTVSLYIQMSFSLNIYGPLYCKLYPGIHGKSLPDEFNFSRTKFIYVGAVGFMVTAQGFTMICISLERTERIRFPLQRQTWISAMKKIGIIWSLALLSDLPRGIFYQYDPNMTNLLKCYNVCNAMGKLTQFATMLRAV